jgi:RsiW-degrading membrane proteinase PrsW (M82 family)
MSTWATWAIVIAMNAICYVAITYGRRKRAAPTWAPLLVLAVTVPIALLGVYRAELSTPAVWWLVFAIALAVPIALLFRLAIPEQWQRDGTFASVAVFTLGIYQFATKGFRPDTFDFWFAVITMSVVTVTFVLRRLRIRQDLPE